MNFQHIAFPNDRTRQIVRALVPLVSGTLLAFAFAPMRLWMLAWLALAPWYADLSRVPTSVDINSSTTPPTRFGDAGARFLYGWMFGVALHLVGAFWMFELGALPWVVLALIQGLGFGVFGVVAGWAFARLQRLGGSAPMMRALMFAALWTLFEGARSAGKLAFPWFNLSSAMVPVLPAMQIVEITAQWGLTFCIVLTTAVLIECFRARRDVRKQIALFLAAPLIPILLCGYGIAALSQTKQAMTQMPKRSVGIVQGNPQRRNYETPEDFYNYVVNLYVGLTRQAHADARRQNMTLSFIAWPEEAMPQMLGNPFVFAGVAGVSREIGVPLIVGSHEYDRENRSYNAAIHLDGYEKRARYDKQRLVPLGEFFPLRFLLDWAYQQYPGTKQDFTEGTLPGYFQFGTLKAENGALVGLLICYEDVFPYVARHRVAEDGAQALVILTSDETFGRTAGPAQHWEQAAIRAIETRRYVVRAATSGESQIIAPTGEVQQRLPLGVSGALVGDIALNDDVTPAARFGEWFLWACGALIVGVFVSGARKRPAPATGPAPNAEITAQREA